METLSMFALLLPLAGPPAESQVPPLPTEVVRAWQQETNAWYGWAGIDARSGFLKLSKRREDAPRGAIPAFSVQLCRLDEVAKYPPPTAFGINAFDSRAADIFLKRVQ